MATEPMLGRVRRKLRVTYEDPAIDGRIEDIIADAEPHMRDMLGVPASFDFAERGPESSLLASYCFYEWNDSLDEFYGNYATEIQACREKWAAKAVSPDAEQE